MVLRNHIILLAHLLNSVSGIPVRTSSSIVERRRLTFLVRIICLIYIWVNKRSLHQILWLVPSNYNFKTFTCHGLPWHPKFWRKRLVIKLFNDLSFLFNPFFSHFLQVVISTCSGAIGKFREKSISINPQKTHMFTFTIHAYNEKGGNNFCIGKRPTFQTH